MGVKHQDYLDFKKVSYLIKTKDHLTILGLVKIKEIKDLWDEKVAKLS